MNEISINQVAILSEKIDKIAILFIGNILNFERKAAHVDTLLANTTPQMFEDLCTALDQTCAKWEYPRCMPTPFFILNFLESSTHEGDMYAS